MSERYDVVVVGAGIVGAATAFHLKKFGAGSVAIIDRDQVCTGGTAKSCAIIRSHYSVPSNTALTVKSLEIFTNFRDALEDNEVECGFVNSGYIIAAPEGDFADSFRANLEMQAGAGAETFEISKEEARERHPLLRLDDAAVVAFEPNSGYADPYLTTSGFIHAARGLGVKVKTNCAVAGVVVDGDKVTGVKTGVGEIAVGAVVVAVGPWIKGVLADIGLDLPLEVSRHVVLTLGSKDPYERTLPAVKDLVVENKMYFRPATGGVVLVGTGDHGDPIDDADTLDDNVATDFIELQSGQIARRMPSFAEAAVTDSWVGAYDITPDWNSVLGPSGAVDGLHIAYGFSGHGFKMAPAVGKMLAKTVLGETPEIDITPYRLGRFADGALLTGAYGVGSIS